MSFSKSANDNKNRRRRIYIVIVESHHHALEHIHSILRKQKIFSSSWSMLHFDAHPDLACPLHVPAAACFTPRRRFRDSSQATMTETPSVIPSTIHGSELNDNGTNACDSSNSSCDKDLYEFLDSTSSGIAEWILPLVLAGNLSHIEWVRPSFATQLSTGHHRFHVGVFDTDAQSATEGQDALNGGDDQKEAIESFLDLPPSARIKVDWNHPYYLDDDSVVPNHKLDLPQPINLKVTQLPCSTTTTTTTTTTTSTKTPCEHSPWLLDICLDYFSCLNPFIVDIEKLDPVFAQSLDNLIRQSRLYDHYDTDTSSTLCPASYQKDLIRFRSLIVDLLKSEFHNELDKEKESPDFSKDFTIFLTQFASFYDTKAQAKSLMESILSAKRGGSITEHRSNQDSYKKVELAIEAIPYWNMPHNKASVESSRIQKSIQQVKEALSLRLRDGLTAKEEDRSANVYALPFMITIARSSDDGFTSIDVVEDLQTRVIEMLRESYCECSTSSVHDCCCLEVIRDYGEWEGSSIPY